MVNYTGRGLVVKRPGVLSKVQMLTLVLGVGVFPVLPFVYSATCVSECVRKTLACQDLLGSVLGRTDFSRIFSFEPPDFSADLVA